MSASKPHRSPIINAQMERRRYNRRKALELHTEHGLPVSVIAARLGVNQSTVGDYLRDKKSDEFSTPYSEGGEASIIRGICAGDFVPITKGEPVAGDAPIKELGHGEPVTVFDVALKQEPTQESDLELGWQLGYLSKLMARSRVSPLERYCLLETQLKGRACRDVGKDIGRSRQSVLNLYRRAVIKLLTHANPGDFGYTESDIITKLKDVFMAYCRSNRTHVNHDPRRQPAWINRAIERIECLERS